MNTVPCTSRAWAALMRRSGISEPYAPVMPVLSIADEVMSQDGYLREFLAGSDLLTIGEWFEGGRLISLETAIGKGSDSALHRLYVLRVGAMLRV
ncbi:hypothetical protein NDU88_007979 [Pleurodeles waltl]|uniref:Uncharacterized protein n=1 Tax=Pleurodeles waltl TaxID=8319 RepID=A0AAV7NCY4_PLEWA|nr:hypothetical protein NDU88_007979 [Pleurodeles waltl]